MRRKSANDIRTLKGKTPIVCLTSYTAPIARAIDENVDLMLVGDSLGMVLYDYENTLQVTLEQMINHANCYASSKSCVIVDMVLVLMKRRQSIYEFGLSHERNKLQWRKA